MMYRVNEVLTLQEIERRADLLRVVERCEVMPMGGENPTLLIYFDFMVLYEPIKPGEYSKVFRRVTRLVKKFFPHALLLQET